jgi:hypothetical protein
MLPPRRLPPNLVPCRSLPLPPCCSIVRRLLALHCRLPAPRAAAANIVTASSSPPALFSRSSRRPPPTLATANCRCRPTAPILALLRPPPALLLVISRPLPAPIVVVGARKGRGGDAAGALLVPKIGLTKARSTTMACRLRPRPRSGGGGVGRRCRPSPRRRFCCRRRGDVTAPPPLLGAEAPTIGV